MKKIKYIITLFIVTLILCNINIYNSKASVGDNYVYLGGFTTGFTLQTRGATVIGITDVLTDKGNVSPCKCAGIDIGDIIVSMNGSEVNNALDIERVLGEYKGGNIVTEVYHQNKKKLCDIFPEKDISGKYKIGLFVQDDLNGLGTITFLTEKGEFASLGHPVSKENGEMFNILGGEVYESTIIGVNKSNRGKAGELKGLFLGSKPIGKIIKNTNVGLFGEIYNFNQLNYRKISLGKAKFGRAEIFSTVDGQKVQKYSIEIIKTDYREVNNKNLVIKITDKDLLSYTGGILQGMSGSPIVQDGRLVGAVTHVFLNDSSRGYGISIENMYNQI